MAKSLPELARRMKVKDPVCGMMIESTTAAAKGTYSGQVVYFCAETCRRTYERTRSPDPK
jgi:YHS domain-containing protein